MVVTSEALVDFLFYIACVLCLWSTETYCSIILCTAQCVRHCGK